jgi:hypothetical protein
VAKAFNAVINKTSTDAQTKKVATVPDPYNGRAQPTKLKPSADNNYLALNRHQRKKLAVYNKTREEAQRKKVVTATDPYDDRAQSTEVEPSVDFDYLALNQHQRENFEPVDKQCPHKKEMGCQLSLGSCCSCADRRPFSEAYSIYVDGVGFTSITDRRRDYCPGCKSSKQNQLG